MSHVITDIRNLGTTIVLDDSSRYEVSSRDRYAVSLWIRGDKVEVSGSRITNPVRRNKTISVTALPPPFEDGD